MAIHELFVLDPSAQRAVLDGADAHQFESTRGLAACARFMRMVCDKVALGFSSLDEVLRLRTTRMMTREEPSDVP